MAYVQNANHAALWSGSAQSWIDLNPADATESMALGAFGTQQVGFTLYDGEYRASLWSGTAESWVDLSPEGAVYSVAQSVFDHQQAGHVVFQSDSRACIWSGTAASWTELHPADALRSRALGTCGTRQVGFVQFRNGRNEGPQIACVWRGTPESRVDLAALMTGNWGNTQATGIWSDGIKTYISGYGLNLDAMRYEAVAWYQCLADFNGDGANDFFDYLDFVVRFAAADSVADVNYDGVIDLFDYLDFVAAFAQGCD